MIIGLFPLIFGILSFKEVFFPYGIQKRLKCPNCQSNRLRTRSTYKSILAIIGLFVVMIMLAWVSHRNHWDILFGLLYISSPIVFCAIIASGFSAIFGINKCLDCKHIWR
jgi:hypothetical protein